jgi:lipoprotein-releasing system ATP-binding protein
MNKNLLALENIHKTFSMGKTGMEILKGIDLSVDKGDIVTLFGPSGAGKSTLLSVMGGISKPSHGKVFLNGTDIYALGDKDLSLLRNSKIGIVFQFYNLLSDFTALENVMVPAMIGKRDLLSRAKALLSELGLGARMNHRPGELSGGEQQRVALARALINEPDVLLADEPTGNLDLENANALFDLILKLNKEKKQTVILVTHNKDLALKTKRIIEIADGKTV